MKLSRDFYNRDTLIVAKELLGKILVTYINGTRLSGRIVETEAYKGEEDKAAHTYGGRKTNRVKPMYGIPGKSYVYFVYGSCFCFNVVTREEGVGQAVLIRAIEPLEGIEQMSINRFNKSLEELTKYQSKNLTNGPGKLCSALKIDKSLNDKDLLGNEIYIEDSNYKDFKIKEAKRVGIDYAEEAKDYLWRFYIEGNKYVSKK